MSRRHVSALIAIVVVTAGCGPRYTVVPRDQVSRLNQPDWEIVSPPGALPAPEANSPSRGSANH